MMGLPGETYEDLGAIIGLASKIKNVNLSIASFIPKPHSGFERESMDSLDSLKDKREYLRSGSKIRMDFHDSRMSRVEAIISRGDKLVGGLIYSVWQKGARLQAWTEYFNYEAWERSFEECGIDPENYLKKREEGANLSWGFIEA